MRYARLYVEARNWLRQYVSKDTAEDILAVLILGGGMYILTVGIGMFGITAMYLLSPLLFQ